MRLLRGLSGRVLSCGCSVGVYETYDGEVVATVDARGPRCSSRDHRLRAVIPIERVEEETHLASSGSQHLTP